mmetsp:Transcript_66400/g.197599  ORF Transcript_66400/g.197599 Transcript_66400/m.197599 type:complete len:350 (-) Transcript_66400:64-1113(-)
MAATADATMKTEQAVAPSGGEEAIRVEMRKKMAVATVDMSQPDAKEKFNRSLQETGFAVLVNHGIKRTQIDDMYDEWKAFMLGLDAKRRKAVEACKAGGETDEEACQKAGWAEISDFLRNKTRFDGYFPMDLAETAANAKVRDIKHYYHLYFPDGRYPDSVSGAAREMFEQMWELGLKLMKWIDDGLSEAAWEKLRKQGMTSLVDTCSKEQTLFRILHYPAYGDGQHEPGAVRAAAHEDINHITLLPVGSSRGLQLYGKEEQKWFDVPFEKESIIINIGDMLQELTDFHFKSTTHRVIKVEGEPEGQDRMSSPVFIHAKPSCFLSDRVGTAHDYLMQRLAQLEQNNKGN